MKRGTIALLLIIKYSTLQRITTLLNLLRINLKLAKRWTDKIKKKQVMQFN